MSRRKDLLEEIYSNITYLVALKQYDHEILGIAMTLFHYYTYIKSLREIDPIELSVACVYLALKIQFLYIPMDQVIDMYNAIKKDKNDTFKKKNPDFIKYEIEIYSFLGYDLDIETPYNWYYKLISIQMGEVFMTDEAKNLLFNLINDIYRNPICLFYHPKVIMISSMIMIARFIEMKDIDFSNLLKVEKIEDIVACMNQIFAIFDDI